MDSGPTLKPKVTVKLNYDRPSSTSTRPPSRGQIPSRPVSPLKSYVSMSSAEPTFRPKAKVNSSATTRKTGAGGSTVSVSNSATSTPRAGSPVKLTPRVKTGVVSPTNNSTRGTLRPPPPVTSAPVTPELRRTIQTQSASSSLRTDDSRSRTNSTSLHHAVSFSSFRPSSTSVVSGSTSASASSSPRLLSAKSTANLAERSQTSSPTPRIRSKVSNVAKIGVDSLPPQPPSPTNLVFQSTRPITSPRTRAPSISSSINQIYQQHPPPPSSPPQQFYPITTAVSAANPHRFATSRPPSAPRSNPSPGHHVFQSFSHQPSSPQAGPSSSPASLNRPRSAGGLLIGSTATAKVDPASIPLPPNSPPASAVSFSSHSSASRSSANASHLGGDPHMSEGGGGHNSPGTRYQGDSENLRATLDNLMQYTSGANSATDDDGDSGLNRGTDGEADDVGEELKVKAAAKSNRKIADLEITNRSLLVINASLEATKHRQAKEIHELRRKLRESRLILPPRAFRAVTSLDPAEVEDDEDDLEGDLEASDAEDTEGDETYKRVKMILDTLLANGKAALETQKEDFSERGTGLAKVLSPEEQRDYHGTNETDQDDAEHTATTQADTILETEMDLRQQQWHELESADIPQGPNADIDPDQDADYNYSNDDNTSFDDIGNETITSEDEVEAMTIFALSPPSSPHPPPILITQPT